MGKKEPSIFLILTGGIIALIIVMGIGRFAYTPILPIMQTSLSLSDSFVGYLASSNFLGYLLGALFAGLLKWKKGKTYYLRWFLIVNVVSTIAMGMTEYSFFWFLLRFVSGLTSGLVFVLASSIVMDSLAKYNRLSWSGIFYSGVGLGILITGVMVPKLNVDYGWKGTWVGLGFISILIGIMALIWLKENLLNKDETKDNQNTKNHSNIKKTPPLSWLVASYGCEGIGYIIMGTFLVAIVQQIPAISHYPTISWILVGAAAIPSSIIWSYVAKQWGNVITLQILFTLQIVGVILPIFIANVFGALIASFLFGATFMGITTLFVTEARSIAPSNSNKVIGYLTFTYGIGQMIGPAISGIFIERTESYNSGLLFSATVLVIGMILLVIYQEKKNKISECNNFQVKLVQ